MAWGRSRRSLRSRRFLVQADITVEGVGDKHPVSTLPEAETLATRVGHVVVAQVGSATRPNLYLRRISTASDVMFWKPYVANASHAKVQTAVVVDQEALQASELELVCSDKSGGVVC